MTATTCGSPARSIGTSNVPAIASLSMSSCQSSVRRRAASRELPSCCPNTENSATSRSAPANTSLQAPRPLAPADDSFSTAIQSSPRSIGSEPFNVTPLSARNSASSPPNSSAARRKRNGRSAPGVASNSSAKRRVAPTLPAIVSPRGGNSRASSRFVGSLGGFASGSGKRNATPDRFEPIVTFTGWLSVLRPAGSSRLPCHAVWPAISSPYGKSKVSTTASIATSPSISIRAR